MFGIEYEMEGMRELVEEVQDYRNRVEDPDEQHPMRVGTVWKAVLDQSLRDFGMELVSVPLAQSKVAGALEELREVLSANPGHSASVRTSVHVHCNVSDMTLPQVLAQYLLSIALEPYMQAYIDPRRRRHLFCLPMLLIPHVGSALRACWEAEGDRQVVEALRALRDVGKYCSVSLFRVRDYGTIEYRAHHGTTDMSQIATWINIISAIRNEALRVQSYGELVDMLVSTNRLALVERVFGEVPEADKDGPYISPEAAWAGAVALVSMAKSNKDSWECSYYVTRSNPSSAAEMMPLAELVRAQGRVTELGAFSSRGAPTVQLLDAALSMGAPVGAMVFDVLVLGEDEVMFIVKRPDEVDGYAVLARRKRRVKLTKHTVTVEVH